MKLHQIDLNLLLLFDALYRHRSVSKAAAEIFLSQSAFSHALGRLRKRLNDDLFIRINNVMQPTLKAQLIAEKISLALPLMEQAINENNDFSPLTSQLELTFTATDFTQFSLLPRLMSQINKQAPHLKLKILPSSHYDAATQLENGDLDFVLGFSHSLQESSTIAYQTWYQGSYCTVTRANHPELVNGLDFTSFLQLPHILIAPWGEETGIVDQQLTKLGHKRNIALQMHSVMVAPYIVAESDLLLTVPRIVAEHCSSLINLDVYPTPLVIDNYQLNIYWHKLNASNSAHRWICDLINKMDFT